MKFSERSKWNPFVIYKDERVAYFNDWVSERIKEEDEELEKLVEEFKKDENLWIE